MGGPGKTIQGRRARGGGGAGFGDRGMPVLPRPGQAYGPRALPPDSL
jgi:hypothetical protein